MDAHEMTAVPAVFQTLPENAGPFGQINGHGTLELAQGRPDQKKESDKSRYGIAWKTEEKLALPGAECERLSWLNGHSPKMQFSSKFRESWLNEVFFANGYSARCNHDIALRKRRRHRLACGREIVRND